jgi:phytoene synthase
MSVVDAQYCEKVLRTHSRTFYLSSLFLPHEKRRGALALYAFCRHTDDLADGPLPLEDRRAALARWREEVTAAVGETRKAVSGKQGPASALACGSQ